MAKHTDRGAEDHPISEVEQLRRHLAEIRGHPNPELMAGLYAEFQRSPGLDLSTVVKRTSLGSTTLYNWWNGESGVSLVALRRLCEDLHPEGSIYRNLAAWLWAGQEYLIQKEQELAKLEGERRRSEVIAEMKARLEREAAAETVAEFIAELDEEKRTEVLRLLAGHLARLVGGEAGEHT